MGDVGTEAAVAERARGARRLPAAYLRPNPRNPRKAFDNGDLDDLASSIKEKGIVQPILVRPIGEHPNSYEIIAGERRWRAAQKAGLHDVPVVIQEATDKEALEIALVENVQRADLNPLEEALGYQQLIDEHHYAQARLAEIIGKSRSHIANTLRLLKLPESVQQYLREGKLTAGHARALVTLADPETAARRIVEAGLSVRDAEAMAPAKLEIKSAKGRRLPKDADTLALEKSIGDALGLTATIAHQPDGGEVRVRYKTLEQLDEICRRLRFG
jgi:ParB family chromosome partitioning protein